MKKNFRILVFFLVLLLAMNTVSATMNVIIITDPTGKDPNGAAGGSMSFAQNMFQSTFLMSKEKQFVVLSGGEGDAINRLGAIVETISRLDNGATASEAAAAASGFQGIRVMTGGPKIGAAVGGTFAAYLVVVEDDGTIKVTPQSGGVASLAPGQRGAIIHLRNTGGNPQYGTAERVRRETAVNIGKMIRDGYSATTIMGKVFEEVSNDAGEKYGGGAVNLNSGLTTGDMFTPADLNQTGYPMNEAYTKVCPVDGWSAGYPTAESYTLCPVDGTPLETIYAYDALANAITVTQDSVYVSVYGSDEVGVSETTKEIVRASVKRNGYNANAIAESLNRAIKNGYIVGVNYVEPKDINAVESSRAVGIYYNPLPGGRTSPPWELPVGANVLDVVGNVQTAIGFVLVLLVLFRSTLLTSFKKR